MKMKLSGQKVYVTPLFTIKTGEHMRLQHAVMQRVPNLAARTYRIGPDTYAMPTYRACDPWDWRVVEKDLKTVWAMNEEDLLPAGQPVFSSKALYDFLAYCNSDLLRAMPSSAYLDLRYGTANEATHGDCTAQNTVMDGCRYRYIDWLWYRRPFIPAHRAVDYGKMMQSVMESEWGNPWRLQEVEPDAAFWAGVHFERMCLRLEPGSIDRIRYKHQVHFCMIHLNKRAS